jgi:SpoIID/LytB domain protein
MAGERFLRRALAALALVAGVVGVATAPGAVRSRAAAAPAVLPQGYGPTVTLTGHGFGHGIGMSQVGAYGYATHFGWVWDQILAHYFGGTTLSSVDPNGAISVRLTANDDNPVVAVIQEAGVAGTSANSYATSYPSLAAVALAPGHYRVYGYAGGVVCPTGTSAADFEAPGSPWAVVAADVPSVDFGVVGVDTTTAPVTSLLGLCEAPGSDQLDGTIHARYYRGLLRAVTGTASEFRTVNVLPLDRYVSGVVPREMPASWGGDAGGAGLNALRAQAVAARSYGLAQNRYSYAKTCDTQSCQVYGGAGYRSAVNAADGGPSPIVSNESSFALQATTDTAGRILVANGAVVSAMYSASSGGYASDEGAFPAVPDDGDQFSPLPDRHDWSATINVSAIEAAFPQIGSLQLLRVTSRNGLGDGGGRVRSLDIIGTAGTVTVTGNAFQSRFGLRSNWFFVPAACDGRVTPPTTGIGAASPSRFQPITPLRVLDTRNGTGTLAAPLAAGCTIAVSVAGVTGVPATGLAAVAVNVTATAARAPGYLTVYPCGQPLPLASSVNYGEGVDVANMTDVRVGTGGQICIYTLSTVDVVVDVLGWFGDSAADGFEPMTPTRALDTRNGTGPPAGRVPAGGALAFSMIDAGVPADAAGVLLNAAATEPVAPGYLTVFPCGVAPPLASTLNYGTGRTVANQAATPIGAGAQVCVASFASTHVVADVLGWFGRGASSRFVSLPPARVLDTRQANAVISGRVPAGGVVTLPLAGRGGLPPTGVRAAVVNVTVDGPAGAGFVIAYPCGGAPPLASNLNYATGQTVANIVTVPVDGNGNACLYTMAAADLVVDVAGYFA